MIDNLPKLISSDCYLCIGQMTSSIWIRMVNKYAIKYELWRPYNQKMEKLIHVGTSVSFQVWNFFFYKSFNSKLQTNGWYFSHPCLSVFSAQWIPCSVHLRVMVIAHNPPIVQVWPGSVGRCMLLYYHHRRNQDPSQMLKQDWKSYYKFTFKGRICSVGPALGLLPNGHQFESPQGHWKFTRLLTSPWE